MNNAIKKMLKTLREFKQFFRYCVVGLVGTVLDLGALFILVEFFEMGIISASIVAFMIAVSNNFVLNKTWTFKSKSQNFRKLYLKFLIISGVGLALTVSSMHVLANLFDIWYMLAKVITSVIVLSWNFLGNKLWTFKIKEKHLKIPEHFPFDLSIVIPAYNEENRIKNTLLIIDDYIRSKDLNAEIIVVSDGSKDNTETIVNEYSLKIKNLSLKGYEKNQGKGHAVKTGILASKGRYILIADADNSTPIEEIERLMKKIKKENAQIAIGSRYLSDSDVQIKQSKFRIMVGRIGNFLIRLFLIDGIKDTQCGFKLFEHQAAQEIFSLQKVKRFGFDMEALVVAKSLGYKIVEVPVSWFNSPESRVRPVKDALITLKDLVFIKLNLWSGRYSAEEIPIE